MRYILSGAAAIALAAGGALAQPGNGNGKGNGADKRGAPAAAAKGDRGNSNDRGNGNGKAERRANDRGGPQKADRAARGADRGMSDRGARSNGNAARADINNGRGNANAGRYDNGNGRNVVRQVVRDGEYRAGDRVRDGDRFDFRRDVRYGPIEGCPPGLAKKRNGCQPPGQAKQYFRDGPLRLDYRPALFGLSGYGGGRYAYDDGYLLRLGSGGGISGYIPLLGGALAVGNPWPDTYRSYDLPEYYVDYYDLGGQGQYRYADDVIYRYDAQDSVIQSIAALLTGDDFRVGQPMPRGYDVYNVPYSYRDRYYDSEDDWYRYSDGYVYRIDPTTKLVSAAIELLI